MNIVILDGNNTAHRSFATLQLTNTRHEDVSVLYGVLQIIRSTLDKMKPDLFIVTWDSPGGSNFRNSLYPEYKGTRHKTDEDIEASRQRRQEIQRQMNVLYDQLRDFGIPQVRVPGFEADDIIYQLTRMLEGHTITVISTDKDMYQLVSDTVRIYNPVKSTWVHAKNFEQMVGVPREQFMDYKIITGDDGDNVPGIKGWGEVTTKKYLAQYGSIAGIMDALKRQGATKKVEETFLLSEDDLHRNRLLVDMSQADLTGLEEVITEEMSEEAKYNGPKVKRFLIDNAFISMLEKTDWLNPFVEL